ncbi:tweety homolog 1 isoform cra_b, partial [Lynx pardinus]
MASHLRNVIVSRSYAACLVGDSGGHDSSHWIWTCRWAGEDQGSDDECPVAGGGLGGPGLGPEPHFHCCLPHPLLLLPAPRAPWGQEPPTRGRLCHLELYRCPSRRL